MPTEDWQPHTVVTHELVDPNPVAALAALLDDGLPAPRPGEELPPLWHWVALARWPPSAQLGPDGHPARGDFLPPIDLPRRMFAGGEVTRHAPIRIGDYVRRESSVESVTEKHGRSGRIAIVVVGTRIYDDTGKLGIEERQNLIYREPGQPQQTSPSPTSAAEHTPAGPPLHRTGPWTWDLTTDPTLLMRFSAATANPHRIHYDWPYATRTEGYPALLVHGPLTTIALAETLRLEQQPGRITHLEHRTTAPTFCGQPARIQAAPTDDNIQLHLTDPTETEPESKTTLTAHIA